VSRTDTASRPDGQNLPRAAVWMLGMLVSLLAMGIAGRELSAELQPHHSAFYRSLLCLLILLPLVLHAGLHTLHTRFMGRHVARNGVHFLAQWCWLFGLGALPLAEVFAIEFSSPIWTALLASLFLSERLTRSRVLAIVLGFTGILVLLRPGIAIIDPASIVVLGAALGYAVAFVFTKNLVGADSPLTVVWWMNVIQLPIGGALSIGNLVVPSQPLMPWLVLLGVSGLTSHLCLSQALKHADVTIVMPMDFLRLPLAALVAWILYAEALDPFLVLGATFILAGNWVNLKRG
jgi:drug/metabolite transporter (DMT)-like permease